MRRSLMLCAVSVLAVPLSAPAAGPADSGGGPVRKKLIQTGWDRPTPSALLANLEAREALPFDGIGISVIGVDDEGNPVAMRDAGSRRPWKQAWFQAQVDTLRQIRSDRLTDNFLLLVLSPPPEEFVDAFDDAGWEVVVEQLRIAAWVAKAGGLKGIMFDPEAYRGSVIRYHSRRHADKSFAEYAAKVRQRGREAMAAMAAEYPDMTFFTLFMHSGIAMGAFGLDPREGLEDARYSLYPAFINGWLDSAPPTLRIVDGFEMAYPHSSELQYLKHANAMRNASLALVDPVNRARYRAQVQTGLAIYLDAFVRFPRANVHADVWTDPPLTGQVQERLQSAVTSALEVVDEYVWVWSEEYRWLRASKHARGAEATWEEALPGVTDALRLAREPEARALARAEREFQISLRKAGLRGVPMRNLARNGDFGNGAPPTQRPAVDRPSGQPAVVREPAQDWIPWRAPGSAGELGRDVTGRDGFGSGQIAGARDAAFVQVIEAQPFRFYRVSAWLRTLGAGAPMVELHWLDAAGAALPGTVPVVLRPASDPGADWQEVSGMARSPGEARQLGLRLLVRGQASPADVAWFDDVEVFLVSVN